MIVRFWNDQSGATTIEYGLVATFVVGAFIGAIISLGSETGTLFDGTSNLVGIAMKQN